MCSCWSFANERVVNVNITHLNKWMKIFWGPTWRNEHQLLLFQTRRSFQVQIDIDKLTTLLRKLTKTQTSIFLTALGLILIYCTVYAAKFCDLGRFIHKMLIARYFNFENLHKFQNFQNNTRFYNKNINFLRHPQTTKLHKIKRYYSLNLDRNVAFIHTKRLSHWQIKVNLILNLIKFYKIITMPDEIFHNARMVVLFIH